MNKKIIEVLALSQQLIIEANNLLLFCKLEKVLKNQSKQNENENN